MPPTTGSGGESISANSGSVGSDLDQLLARIEKCPEPGQPLPSESLIAYQDRWNRALKEWVKIAFEAHRIDRTRKKEAQENPAWAGELIDQAKPKAGRTKPNRKDEGAKSATSQLSGFMKTINAPSQFEDVPLCPTLVCRWRQLASSLKSRLTAANEHFGGNFASVKKEVLESVKKECLTGGGKGSDSKRDAWEHGLESLFDIETLEREIAQATSFIKSNPHDVPSDCEDLRQQSQSASP